VVSYDEAIVNALQPFVAKIDEARPLRRSVAFNPATWRRWLTDSDATSILEDFQGAAAIERADLVKLASEARSGADGDRVRLFVATMIWGSGTTNGRGPRYAHAALADSRLVDCLGGSHALCHDMKFESAYASFELSGVGPAFFTKWFWASTLGAELALVPLILDARVWRSLGSLGWDSRVAAGSRHWGDRYVAYLEAMRRWSNEIEVSAEELEWLLFTRAGRMNASN
jgi:hypothetical protein